MNLPALIKTTGFHPLVPPRDSTVQINHVFAGDRMSDLLAAASDDTLLVTHLNNQGIIRLIELMEVPAICFLNGVRPSEEVLAAAREYGTCVLSSPKDMFYTCGILYQLIHPNP